MSLCLENSILLVRARWLRQCSSSHPNQDVSKNVSVAPYLHQLHTTIHIWWCLLKPELWKGAPCIVCMLQGVQGTPSIISTEEWKATDKWICGFWGKKKKKHGKMSGLPNFTKITLFPGLLSIKVHPPGLWRRDRNHSWCFLSSPQPEQATVWLQSKTGYVISFQTKTAAEHCIQ